MNIAATKISLESNVRIHNYLPRIGKEKMVRQILSGLQSKQKYISSMFFYDEIGSKLFEEITGLPEYYPTRTEIQLITEAGEKIGSELREMDIVELGSGDCSKISLLLQAISHQERDSIRYIPVDVSYSAVEGSARRLQSMFPEITIHGIVADFLSQLSLIPKGNRRLFCFFGSTIGNLSRFQANHFIKDIGLIMQPGDQLLLGVDMVKDVNILEKAYNDYQGVTAAFNLNILNVINNLIGTDFDPEMFEHTAFYNYQESRIEMHLRALYDMNVVCPHLTKPVSIERGETIHTENSHKYTNTDIKELADESGLLLLQRWTDPNRWFTLVHFGK